ncbi:MAG: alanyl-tRNA editing protein [Anaerolinea sp.]|nr:alanyl-tRNA editing protein [Anaerolinea sp.]MCC6973074.1 alanyl-tRNA editing protein [Anaerolineae bacterium]
MTEMIYQTDSYVQQFSATVRGSDPETRTLILERTAFYPGGGGQPHDLGEIRAGGRTLPVVKVQKQGDEVAHVLGGEAPLPEIGTVVEGQLDWTRRYQLMRIHTALHILSAVCFRDYGAQVTGGNMEPLKGRLDFEFESLQGDFVKLVEAAINQEVKAAREVRVKILPREEAFQIPDLIRTKVNLLPEGITLIRTVEIVGLDLQADGGTHVHNSSEVGLIRVSDYKSKGKLNKRIYIELT